MAQTMHDPGPRPQDIALVKNIVANNKVFIDTCSLIHEKYPQLENLLFTVLQKAGAKLIVPLRVVDELKRFEADTNHGRSKAAVYALQSLARHQRKGLISLKGEESDNFTDNVFLCQFAKFRLHDNLALITQDVALAHDLRALNGAQSQTGNLISAYRITQYGTLGRNDGDIVMQQMARSGASPQGAPLVSPMTGNGTRHQCQNTSRLNSITEDKLYTLKKQITNVQDSLIATGHIPGEGEAVTKGLGQRETRLVRLLASGGEGAVFETDEPDVVCKIYRQDCLTMFRLEKLRRMIGNGFRCEGICWPTDVALNREGKPVGYFMPKASGIELQKSVFIYPLLKKHFGSWKKKDTVRLVLTILEKIRYLHHHNIIIGDINPLNILVKSPEEVYFVDTDSYQIEEFPCFVGTVPFTAPEAQRKNFKTFLRTQGNERFALATLLFMIMLPGKHPYAQQGGEDPATNICNMDFSYPLGTSTNKKTPNGQWRFCWSHLPYKIKEAFYKTFRKDGEYADENERLSVPKWMELFAEYLWLLETGKFEQQDPESRELFPTRFKNVGNAPLEPCTLCARTFPDDQLQQGYCPECLKRGEEHPCRTCRRPIMHTNYQRLIAKKAPYTVCWDCHQKQDETYAMLDCGCGREFTITNGEKDFYAAKGLELPKRCPICRREKRVGQPVPSTPNSQRSDSSSSNGIGSIFETLFRLFS